MNTASTVVLVEYVGLKDREEDHLYGTGIVWTGKGDVQEVPASAWSRMRKHVDVWRELVAQASSSSLQPAAPAPVAAPAPAAPEAAAPAAPANQDGLDAKTKEELHAIAKERGLIVHPNAGAAKVIEALRAATGA